MSSAASASSGWARVEEPRPSSSSPTQVQAFRPSPLACPLPRISAITHNRPLFSSALEMQRTIKELQVPDKMDTLQSQVTDVEKVILKPLEDALAGSGVQLSREFAAKLFDSLERKLFEGNRIRCQAKEEIKELQKLFNQHDQGSTSCLAQQLTLEKQTCDQRMTICRFLKSVGQSIGHPLRPEYAEPTVCIAASVLAPLLLKVSCRRPRKSLLTLSFLLTFVGLLWRRRWAVGDAPDAEEALNKLEKQSEAVQDNLHWLEMTGQELKTAEERLQALDYHHQPLQDLRKDFDEQLQLDINERRINAKTLAKILDGCDLGHISGLFMENQIDGLTFVETLDENDFQKLGVNDSLDIRRLLALKDPQLLMEKAKAQLLKEIVERAKVHVDAYGRGTQAVKELVSNWRQGLCQLPSAVA